MKTKAAELTLEDVSLQFGGVRVLNDVSFSVAPGTICGLVGPNGAGKTSLFNCISGHYRLTSGTIRIDETVVSDTRPARMVRHGLARTFQHPALQLHETVLENVMLGGHSALPGGPLAWALTLPRTRRSERAMRNEAIELLERVGLGWAVRTSADELSHGLHKSIELCRALLSKPRLLLLDEPAAGLSQPEVDALAKTVRDLANSGEMTIVLVEHNMGLISELSDQVVVLNYGSKLMEGTAQQVQNDPRVLEAYLGEEEVNGIA